jgi:uncharacterized radical SAM superfamily Fe-S cluster-containing enzyme
MIEKLSTVDRAAPTPLISTVKRPHRTAVPPHGAVADCGRCSRCVAQIHLDVSSRCDQHCPLCYRPAVGEDAELSVAQLAAIASKYPGKAFILGGREPTCRSELAAIIRAVGVYGSVMLLTHGLRLADEQYLRSLLHAGLDGVIFSFNGLTDAPYEVLNGSACLEPKLESLRMLRRLKVPTVLSMTVMPGVNTDQIGSVVRFCQDNTDFIKELRIRAARDLGRDHAGNRRLLRMSDLNELIAAQAGFKMDTLSRGMRFWHSIGRAFDVDAYRPRGCTQHFMLRRRGRTWMPEGALLHPVAEAAVAKWKCWPWARPLLAC